MSCIFLGGAGRVVIGPCSLRPEPLLTHPPSRPSIPTPLTTRATSRQLRSSPLTADGNSVTPESVAAGQRAATAPITDREPSATALANLGTPPPVQSQHKRPRGKKSHALACLNPPSFAPRSASLSTRDVRAGPHSVVGVKPEPNDDPFISHTDPPLEPFDPHVGEMDGTHTELGSVLATKVASSSRRKGKGKDNVMEIGDHEADGAVSASLNKTWQSASTTY